MPSLAAFDALKSALVTDVSTAWPMVQTVHVGPVRVPEPVAPFAVIDLEPVSMQFETVTDTTQVYRWTVYGVFRLPGANTHPMEEAVDRIAALSARLESAVLYADVGMLPLVVEADPSADLFSSLEGVYTVRLVFECRVRAAWGS